MSATREKSSQAQAAACIRKELKAAFPTVKFSVTSSSFSMGDSVDIGWTNGPTTDQVNAITRKYQHGHFDGMIDLYEYSNRRDDIPQSKYVQCQRTISRDVRQNAIDFINKRFGWDMEMDQYGGITRKSDVHTGNGWRSDEIHRTIYKTSLICPYLLCSAALMPTDKFCPECGNPMPKES